MNAILTIAALVAAVTAREIVQAVSDHVKVKDNVCLRYADETGNYTLVNRYGNIYTVKRKDIVKTGRHFPEVAALLDKLKGDAPDV